MECLHEASRFRALERDWRFLHRNCADVTPFTSWEWLFSWWQAYGASRQLRLLTWRAADGTLVGIAPLYLAAERTALGTECRVLRFVGDGTFDSDYLGLLIHPPAFSSVVRDFGEWLGANKEWDALVLRELSDQSGLPSALRSEAERLRFQFRLEQGRCGALDLPRSWSEFLQARQSRFRTKLRSLLRKIDDGGLSFESGWEPRDLKRRLRSLFALHQQRWHEADAPGVFGDTAKRLFYAHFVPRFGRSGWLRLYSLRHGPNYVAHQLCFGSNGTTYLLQEGFDVSNPSASYGQMLRAAVIRHLIESGERQYDFLGGVSKHKQDWGAREQQTTHLIIARNELRGRLYFSLPVWRDRLAGGAKRMVPEFILKGLRRPKVANS